jgi:hypothetical protein
LTGDDTLHHRPTPKRPSLGWHAWQATVGYISHEHNPDAVLTVTAYPVEDEAVGWTASLFWGDKSETVHDEESFGAALRSLWFKVEARHKIFRTLEAAVKRPVNYDEGEWLEPATQAALDRVLQAAAAAFAAGWRIAITYQPVDNPDGRVQAGLYSQDGTLQIEGSGPTLRDACQTLFRSAAGYFANSTRQTE